MGFLNVRQLAASREEGRELVSHFRKVPGQASVANWWTDLSMAAGNPVPNYYASTPLAAATLTAMRGLFHGDDKSPAEKYLLEWMLLGNSANLVGRYVLADYLLYYPFVDLDSDATQDLDNTVTLPRYESGDGVQAMMVCVAPTIGSGQFTFQYINQAGDEKTSPTQLCGTTAGNIATLVNQQPASVAAVGPWLKLADGDTGIRRVLSLTMAVPNGGLGSLVLVKPLVDHVIREASRPHELTLVANRPGPVRVHDGAYLGMLSNTAGSVAGLILTGRMNFVWTPAAA